MYMYMYTMTERLPYLLNPLRVPKHIRPRSECAIGFFWVLVVQGDSMLSCSPSSLSPLSSSMFLSVGLLSCGPQGSTWGQLVVVLLVVCTAQSISISFARLAVWLVLFLFVLATHSLRLSGASIYGESCAGTCSESLLACGWWFWSSSRILRHTVECLRARMHKKIEQTVATV